MWNIISAHTHAQGGGNIDKRVLVQNISTQNIWGNEAEREAQGALLVVSSPMV